MGLENIKLTGKKSQYQSKAELTGKIDKPDPRGGKFEERKLCYKKTTGFEIW